MKVQIDLVGPKARLPGQPESPNILKMRARLEEIFSAYDPKRVPEDLYGLAIIHSVLQVAPGEQKFEQLLESFGQELEKMKVGAAIRGELAGAEVKRARYLEIATAGEGIT